MSNLTNVEKKILVLIINYGTNQINYCINLINHLNSIEDYIFDIKVFSSSDITISNCENILIKNYDINNFALSAYDYLKNNDLSEYTHVLLTENDLFFTKENFDFYFEYENKFSHEDIVIGFLRYEILNFDKFLIDCGYGNDKVCLKTKNNIAEIIHENLYRFENCHQGCWMFQTSRIKTLLNDISIGETLEDKVSNYFYSNKFPGNIKGVKKYRPICEFEKLLVHHQPNKYVKIYNNLLSVTHLLNQRSENFICN